MKTDALYTVCRFSLALRPKFISLLAALFVSGGLTGFQAHALDIGAVINESSFDNLVSTPRFLDSQEDLREAERLLWKKYQKTVSEDGERRREMTEQQIRHGNSVMRFSLEKRGRPGPHGYPLYIAFHGGGGGPSWLNDSQWEAMKVYYRDSVDNGIYVATRGISDTWNLHFMPESYSLYDHLISNLIALENVDPNRVYVLGFSAGGDGVYQVATRMPDRWAGADMSAGHSNGVF